MQVNEALVISGIANQLTELLNDQKRQSTSEKAPNAMSSKDMYDKLVMQAGERFDTFEQGFMPSVEARLEEGLELSLGQLLKLKGMVKRYLI